MIWVAPNQEHSLPGGLAQAATKDPQAAIFQAQTHRLASIGTVIGAAVACGLRDNRWSEEKQFKVTAAMTKLATNLWPNVHEDETQGAAYMANLVAAFEDLDAAVVRGAHPTPADCVTIGTSGSLDQLDEMVKQ
jgi:hypothetical protein